MLSKKDSRNELSDEDILNGINSTDYSNENNKAQNTSNDEIVGNDFVDSSLFLMDDTKQEGIVKSEPVALSTKIEKKQIISANSLGDITREKELMAEELSQEEGVVTPEDTIVIQGSKTDAKSGFKWTAVVLVLITMVLAGGAWYMFLDDKKEEKVATVPEVSIDQQQESNNSQEVEAIVEEKGKLQKIDLSKMKIDVYNGSGVAGAAGKIKDTLVGQKYENIEAKNYPTEKSATTALYYKEDNLKEEAQKIADFLKNNELEMEIKLASSEEEKSADIVIVLGK
ncbi:MAG TPA: hypothetical protein DDY52_01405 [Candidatus Moranbacteria bacterium]|nr:MAG: hypothetical protein UR51_C0007G0029 [Candidatus Moranbacteria bacterium GW2011_GWF1_34_10]HBI16801.1 hypothetical protein [Candidatus Moranbacteria bacterium]